MNRKLHSQLESLKKASYRLQTSTKTERNQALKLIKKTLQKHHAAILKANQKDLAKMDQNDPLYDRLLLTEIRLKNIEHELETVIKLPDPLNQVLESSKPTSGIHLKKISVPLGCIGVIYEARPNVTIDVSSLCLKSGNAVLLRGSSNAYETNQLLVKLIQQALHSSALPKDSVQLMETDRELSTEMMQSVGYLDLIIPRGSASLIQHVRAHSKVPTIETGASVVHTFVDATADLKMALNIISNEKMRRPSVCNALDTVLVHQKIASKFLPLLAKTFEDSEVMMHAGPKSYKLLKPHYELLQPDAEKHFDHEFLGLEMNVKIVKDLDQAIAHIRQYSLKHSESIVTKTMKNAEKFQREVDAACVYVNTSTGFTDGAQFGLGAEIGISTQKLHARGPMGLKELTSYKWLISSNGKIRI